MPIVTVSASFDDPRSPDVRFLHEASRHGRLHVLLWSDALVERETGAPPRFPGAERRYFVEAIRWVNRVSLVDAPDDLPDEAPDLWLCREGEECGAIKQRRAGAGIECRMLGTKQLLGFPLDPGQERPAPARKVIVTGCYDWLHSGHVRFFEEAASYGDLYVVVGSDANVRLLKGAGHPQYPEDERRYMAGAIRHVHQALVSTGTGWMDAEPQIAEIGPDTYLVNEDGDKPEKRAFCREHGLEYVVLKRIPADGLPRRQSTDLRGF